MFNFIGTESVFRNIPNEYKNSDQYIAFVNAINTDPSLNQDVQVFSISEINGNAGSFTNYGNAPNQSGGLYSYTNNTITLPDKYYTGLPQEVYDLPPIPVPV